MEPLLVDELDKRYARLGYANRTELFTAFAYAIIDRLKTKEDDLVFTCAKDLKGNMPQMTEHQIEKHLDELIGSMFKPVIAMRNSDVACKAGTKDILEEYYARYSIFLTEEEIQHAFRRYELMNKSTLREYRIKQMMKKYENTHTAEPSPASRSPDTQDTAFVRSEQSAQEAQTVQQAQAVQQVQQAQQVQTAYPAHSKETMKTPDTEHPMQIETKENPNPRTQTNGELPNEMH